MGILTQLAGQLGAFGLNELANYLERGRQTKQAGKSTQALNQYLEELAQAQQNYDPQSGLLNRGGMISGHMVPDIPQPVLEVPWMGQQALTAANQYMQAPMEQQLAQIRALQQLRQSMGGEAFRQTHDVPSAMEIFGGAQTGFQELQPLIQQNVQTTEGAKIQSKKELEDYKAQLKRELKATPTYGQTHPESGGGGKPLTNLQKLTLKKNAEKAATTEALDLPEVNKEVEPLIKKTPGAMFKPTIQANLKKGTKAYKEGVKRLAEEIYQRDLDFAEGRTPTPIPTQTVSPKSIEAPKQPVGEMVVERKVIDGVTYVKKDGKWYKETK